MDHSQCSPIKQQRIWSIPFYSTQSYPILLAAVQAPVIMMSQNRKETIDRRRAENDCLINLKAETQIQMLEEKIDLMVTEQMKNLFKLQEAQTTLLKDIKKHVSK